MASTKRVIELTDKESKLRVLLLNASTYIGALNGSKTPKLRFTGGWVRDKLLGITSHDIDIGIDNMTGFQFGTMLKKYLEEPDIQAIYEKDALGSLAKIEANPEKSKHLETVTTRFMGLDIDLVNLRKEIYSENSRNPSMEFGTPEEDALRRDATVNALFYNLQSKAVEDFTGRGLADMERGIIKTPLAPLQTFKDDPLRVLRSIRFASRLGYMIAPEDEIAMADDSIKAALRLKISRERIGIEITKMLNDRNAHRAITLIDRNNLYNTVFTDPKNNECKVVDTYRWSIAYDLLSRIVEATKDMSIYQAPLYTLKLILLRDSHEIFLAWMLVCFVPWAREVPNPPKKVTAKKQPSPAFLAAREGIKADNKICKVIDAAANHLQEVIDLKDSIMPKQSSEEQVSIRREVHGQAIRAWGSEWRSVIMFALLTEVMETKHSDGIGKILEQYARWMSALEFLDLLDVDKLVPLVKGDQLCKALGGIKSGPWLKQALDIAMEWQLRNPEKTDSSEAIAEVLGKRNSLAL